MSAASPTYPGQRSNDPQSNSEPFRDSMVLNQPAGGIEWINTKDSEMLTVYYKDGSFARFNKLSYDILATKDKREHIMGEARLEVGGNTINIHNQSVENIILGDQLNKTGDVDKWQPFQNQIKAQYKTVHDYKRLFEIKRTKLHNSIDQSPFQTKVGILAPCPVEQTQTKVIKTTTTTKYLPAVKIPCFHQIPVIEDIAVDYETLAGGGGKMFGDGWDCLTCWGTGNSPSSQDGVWDIESLKQTITQKQVDIQTTMFDFEKHLGQNKHREGGTRVDKISKDWSQMIGLSFNDLESFRIDPVGKLVPYGIKIDPFGTGLYMQYRESPLVENIHVEKFPAGQYDLIVCDNFNLTVGSNGINLKTSGMMETYAPIINTTAEAMMFNARNEITMGAKRFDISGEIITLRPKKVQRQIEDASGNFIPLLPANLSSKTQPEQQVLVDGNLNVALNAVVKGGMHVEGEVTLHHITAPLEYQITDGSFEYGLQLPCALDPTVDADCVEPVKSPVYADIVEGCLIGLCYVGAGDSAGVWPVYSLCAPNSVMVHDHQHYFKNLPLKLIRDNVDVAVTVGNKTDIKTLDPNGVVRAVGARNNFAAPVLSKPVQNSKTNNTVLEKFGGSVCAPLQINNTNWETSNIEDTRPPGQGTRTSAYTDDILQQMTDNLEATLEQKYKDQKTILSGNNTAV